MNIGLDAYEESFDGFPYAFVAMSIFTTLVVQVRHEVSGSRMEYAIHERFFWMRFLDFNLGYIAFSERSGSIIVLLGVGSRRNQH